MITLFVIPSTILLQCSEGKALAKPTRLRDRSIACGMEQQQHRFYVHQLVSCTAVLTMQDSELVQDEAIVPVT